MVEKHCTARLPASNEWGGWGGQAGSRLGRWMGWARRPRGPHGHLSPLFMFFFCSFCCRTMQEMPRTSASESRREDMELLMHFSLDKSVGLWRGMHDSSNCKMQGESHLFSVLKVLKADLGFVTLGLCESGCKFALSPPTVGRKTQMCTLMHTNLESQIPSLLQRQLHKGSIHPSGEVNVQVMQRESRRGNWIVERACICFEVACIIG